MLAIFCRDVFSEISGPQPAGGLKCLGHLKVPKNGQILTGRNTEHMGFYMKIWLCLRIGPQKNSVSFSENHDQPLDSLTLDVAFNPSEKSRDPRRNSRFNSCVSSRSRCLDDWTTRFFGVLCNGFTWEINPLVMSIAMVMPWPSRN